MKILKYIIYVLINDSKLYWYKYYKHSKYIKIFNKWILMIILNIQRFDQLLNI